MKTIKLVTLSFALLAMASLKTNAQCNMYAPAKEGSVSEIKQYDEKDKLTGSQKQTVTSAKNSEVVVKVESFDKKDKPVGTSEIKMKCENGAFIIDMRSMIPQSQHDAYKDMKVSVTADQLDIPASPTAGQTLKNGTVKMSATQEGSPLTMNFAITVLNRKVEAIEEITVPAGTFKCVKISYDVETKNMFTIRGKGMDWYAEGIGMVKSETYNSKGKLQGYSVLTKK